ncbi:unnamed protein product [Closterium sp. Naga37s-1]|nr:unnamed protein product [Closterium sp. Naga37s-1]
MRWCLVPAGSIRHLLQLGLGRLGVVLGFPRVCLPGLLPPPQLHHTPLFELRRGVLPSGSHSPVRLPSQSGLLVRRLVRLAMPVSIGDDYSYSPRPFVVASAAVALPTVSAPAQAAVAMPPLPAPRSAPSSVTPAGPVLAPAAAPFPVAALLSAPAVASGPAHVPSPAPALASASAPAPAPATVAASEPARPPVPAPVAPPVPVEVSAPAPAVAATTAAVGAGAVPPPEAPAEAPSAAAADPSYRPPPATSAGLSLAEVQSTRVAPPNAPSGQPRRPQSPGRRQSRPHSPFPHNERESSRRRQDSPRGRRSQGKWTARRGGRGGWWGGRGYGRGAAPEEPPMTPAEIRQLVTAAVRDARADAAGPGSPHRAAPLPGISSPAVRPAADHQPAPPPRAVPQFRAQDPSRAAGVVPLPVLAGPPLPPQARVPEATLGQLWRLSESLRALLLVQVTAHASLPPVPAESLLDGPRDDCMDAADQLALLLAPVLAAPARGGVAAVGQLDAAVRGLRRDLRAGSGADAIAASTLVVREVWRTLSGLLAALEADRM